MIITTAEIISRMYFLKRVMEKAESLLKECREHIGRLDVTSGLQVEVENKTKTFTDSNGLQVTFVGVQGRKQFSKDAALETARKYLPEDVFKSKCVSFKIESIPGKVMPKELVEQVAEYLRITPVSSVTEEILDSLPLSKAEKEEAYVRGNDTERMEMRTKISDERLQQIVQQTAVGRYSEFLIEGRE